MTAITARLAATATMALAAVFPAAALTTVAHAETHVPTSVRIADLDLATADGRSVFAHRADTAARIYCSREFALDQKAACETAVRAEVADKAKMRFASR
jgi:UrcA family protein